MTLFPVELLEKVIKLLYVSEHRSPAALGPVSLSSRCANKLAQKLQFQTASISTYRNLVIYQEILDGAPHLFQCIKTLRVCVQWQKKTTTRWFLTSLGVALGPLS
jgi:hypothetical protein